MRTITTFTFITLNGYFKGPQEDISWHIHDEEGSRYSEQQLSAGNILVFGRKTYEMMHHFWPTPMAHELFPKVAEGMNRAEKIVLSQSLSRAEWANTRVLSADAIGALERLKSTPGKNITILGSGSVVVQLASAHLIDRYEILLDPVAIPNGSGMFEHIHETVDLKLEHHQVFKNGSILLTYIPD